jgi:hypothetical protein
MIKTLTAVAALAAFALPALAEEVKHDHASAPATMEAAAPEGMDMKAPMDGAEISATEVKMDEAMSAETPMNDAEGTPMEAQ